MERFDYAAAQKEFEDAIRLAPDAPFAKINLGIALFNQNTPEAITRATSTFGEILAADPNNRHAHFCLGIILMDRGRTAEAYAHFEAVSKLDPDDAHTWFRLGSTHPAGRQSPEARECFERALKLNPYLNAARYNLMLLVYPTDPARAKQLETEFKALIAATWESESATRYGVMGRYADVIGRVPTGPRVPVGPLPLFEAAGIRVNLAPGARWAVTADLSPLHAAARSRFGGTVAVFDFNKDGRPDVLLLAAVVENGAVRDLLLRNDGGANLTDVTAAAGLGGAPSLGCAAGDFDNDGFPDLALTGPDGVRLFRNTGAGGFTDVSAAVQPLKGTFLGCVWADIDQDSDLDLILCRYADTAAGANGFTPGAVKTGGLVVMENVGEALKTAPNAPGRLATKFRPTDALPKAAPTGGATALVVSDLDSDRDVDVLALTDGEAPAPVLNDRLMRFHRATAGWATGAARWNGGLAFDANHDERSDLLLLPAGEKPVYLLSKGDQDFTPGVTNAPPLRQAVAADIDWDGWTDVVGLTPDGRPVLLHNRGEGKLEQAPDAFGAGAPASAHAITVADLDGDGRPDLLQWSDAGLHLHRSLDNGNRAVLVEPTGTRDAGSDRRTNADGIGCWLVAQAGAHWTGAERVTVSAGLGQSLAPTTLGLGRAGRADVVRVRWPDAVLQAELEVNAGRFAVAETNRKGTSCPVLMAWDGERFAFVTDFLGGGALGESGPDGSVRPPRPEESVKIEPGQLVPNGGQYVIKIAEPMDEVLYLDHLRLDVIDHPANTGVFPDERFVFSGPEPTQQLLTFRTPVFPRTATDHVGRDVTARVRERDRRAADTFAVRSWLGYAEDHALTLDFGELPKGGNLCLVLAGWTEYPYPESMFAATRAGVALRPPVLEQFDPASGKWEPVCDLGFPAGLPRVMTSPLPALKSAKLRISTNMQVFWDQIYLAPAEEAAATGRVTPLDVSRADLAPRGFMQEVYPDGRRPVAYDDAKTEPVPVLKWGGNLTKLGEVTDLLHRPDDRFVLCGPGDEITARFDATRLPPLPAGWVRSFVLRTRGYCKDTATTTVTGGTVGPLPFRAMPNYPDFGSVKPPATDADRWHTRPAAGR
ncbi:FG-GAP-like repeat-containing protein [Gemmata sp. JC717]|uniref:FG-GAP-like repeat-containing protein n=1 Tax=Gemmata algarum TaxID=2975278 RepID=UPI0021BA8999|nr:FG-GAP-like repeat-containing protein [Gemmata algarum]MDY3555204.1 FG-GAP-like repeat-containing protein [Gemmata algarum]